jgi:hypothetical protein
MSTFVRVKHRLYAYVHIERRKKTRFNHHRHSTKRWLIHLGKELVMPCIYTYEYMCILDTRVASNRRVTCTYVSLNKHSTVVTSYHVKVTILCCIMNELRQIYFSDQPFLYFLSKVRNKKKKDNHHHQTKNIVKAMLTSSLVFLDGLRILIYSL